LDILPEGSWGRIKGDDSKYIWLLRNLDFKDWYSKKTSSSLGVSTPIGLDLTPCLASLDELIVGGAQQVSKTTRIQPLIVHFMCDIKKMDKVFQSFVLGLFYQTVQGLSLGNAVRRRELEKKFLLTILTAGFPAVSLGDQSPGISDCLSKILDHQNNTLSKHLESALEGRLASVMLVLVIEKIHHLLPGPETSRFIRMVHETCECLKKQCGALRVLYAMERRTDVKGLLENIPWIEYDEERKGESISQSESMCLPSQVLSL
jgi:hypothetical protein